MKGHKRKVVAAEDSVYDQGPTATVLFAIVAIMMPLMGSRMLPDFLGLERFGSEHWVVVGVMLMVTMILAAVATHLARRHKRLLQFIRDREVEADGPFALYLRPFATDKSIQLPNPFASLWAPGGAIHGLGSEEFVGSVLEQMIPVRQMGGNTETVGTSRLSVADTNWQQSVIETVREASMVVIMPIVQRDPKAGVQSGQATMWELSHLVRSGRLAKTIILMPRGARNVRKGWESARELAGQFGLSLPPYRTRGACLTFEKSEGQWRVDRTFSGSSLRPNQLALGLIQAAEHIASKNPYEEIF